MIRAEKRVSWRNMRRSGREGQVMAVPEQSKSSGKKRMSKAQRRRMQREEI